MKKFLAYLVFAAIGFAGSVSAAMIRGYDTNNSWKPVTVEAGPYFRGISLYPEQKLGGLSVFLPVQGGTGIGSATTPNIGQVLTVSSSNPFTYKFSTPSGGTGGVNTSTINYFAVYQTATTTTGTSFAQLVNNGVTFTNATSTNLNVGTLFSFLQANGTSITSTNLNSGNYSGSGTFTNVTSTNLSVSGLSVFATTTMASSGGRVAIGTTTLVDKLMIQGLTTATSSNTLTLYNSNGTNTMKVDDAGNIYFGNSGLYYESTSTITYINNLNVGPMNLPTDAGIVSWTDMTITNAATGTAESYTAQIGGLPMIQVYADAKGVLTGGAQNQSVSINTTTTSTLYKLMVDGPVQLKNLTTSAASTSASAMCLDANNQIIADSVNCLASSRRVKKDIKPLTIGIDEIMQFNPVSFKYKESFLGPRKNNPNFNGTQFSLIAEEVQKVDPRLVSVETSGNLKGKPNGLQSLNNWVGLFIKGFQDLEAQISHLISRQDDADARIERLEKQVKLLTASK